MGVTTHTFEHAFQIVEQAVDAHPLLVRVDRDRRVSEATLDVSRLGFTIKLSVKRRGVRGNPTVITGSGETLAEAVEGFVSHLDIWAQVLAEG
jgi:hypothetical protein